MHFVGAAGRELAMCGGFLSSTGAMHEVNVPGCRCNIFVERMCTSGTAADKGNGLPFKGEPELYAFSAQTRDKSKGSQLAAQHGRNREGQGTIWMPMAVALAHIAPFPCALCNAFCSEYALGLDRAMAVARVVWSSSETLSAFARAAWCLSVL